MALNSVVPYSIEQNGLEYSFVTKVGLRYKVYFHESDFPTRFLQRLLLVICLVFSPYPISPYTCSKADL